MLYRVLEYNFNKAGLFIHSTYFIFCFLSVHPGQPSAYNPKQQGSVGGRCAGTALLS